MVGLAFKRGWRWRCNLRVLRARGSSHKIQLFVDMVDPHAFTQNQASDGGE